MATAKKTGKTSSKKANVKMGDLKPQKDAKGGASVKRQPNMRGGRNVN